MGRGEGDQLTQGPPSRAPRSSRQVGETLSQLERTIELWADEPDSSTLRSEVGVLIGELKARGLPYEDMAVNIERWRAVAESNYHHAPEWCARYIDLSAEALDIVESMKRDELQLRHSRALDARAEVMTSLGLLRVGSTEGLERRLEIALDRLERLVEGEDYIEKSEKLREQTDGAFHFTPPPDSALPRDVRGD